MRPESHPQTAPGSELRETAGPRRRSGPRQGLRRGASPVSVLSAPGADLDLHGILTAHLHAQHMRTLRMVVLHLLASAGGICWILLSWPSVLPPSWRLIALIAWPMVLALLLLSGLLEWKWNSRLLRLTLDEQPHPGIVSERPGGER